MKITNGELQDVRLVAPDVHGDERGFFIESFRRDALLDAGIDCDWVQDNHSRSKLGTIRGMHFDSNQSKLVRCARGAIFDVICDIRVGSPTFGRWEGYRLDDEQHLQLFVPRGFAHGFCVLSDLADVVYKVSDYYNADTEGGFSFEDPEVGIEWPAVGERIVSARDSSAPRLSEIVGTLKVRYRG